MLAVFIPLAASFPFFAFRLTRTPEGAQVLFWAGPWSAAFWTLLYGQLSACKFWLGAEHVRQWREANGGLLHTSIIATCWMFGALFFSYIAELLFIVATRNFTLLPIATYSPLFFCWCWRRGHHA